MRCKGFASINALSPSSLRQTAEQMLGKLTTLSREIGN